MDARYTHKNKWDGYDNVHNTIQLTIHVTAEHLFNDPTKN